MLPELQLMLSVQELDVEIRNYELRVREVEPILQQIAKDRDRRLSILSKLEKQLADIQSRKRTAEQELRTNEDKLKNLQRKQSLVKTPKEAEAVAHELETTESSISTLEEEVLSLMDKDETHTADLEEKKATSDRLDAKGREQELRARETRSECADLLKGLREDRIVAANKLPSDLRDSYEWVFKMHGPSVIVPLKGEACGGCGAILVPHLVVNIHQGKELTQCTSCHRYVTDDRKDD